MSIILLVVIILGAFIALVFTFQRVMISTASQETKRLQDLNLENTKKAVALQEKIEEADRQYKEKLAQAQEEIRQLKEKAIQETGAVRADMLAKAKEERGHLIDQALDAREKLREEIESSLLEKSLELARRIIAEILHSPHQRLVYDGLMEDVLQEMEVMDIGILRGSEVRSCHVQTSHPLDVRQKERLTKILSEKTGQKIFIEETIDKKVITGIIVHIGSFMIDGSLMTKFKKAGERIRHGG